MCCCQSSSLRSCSRKNLCCDFKCSPHTQKMYLKGTESRSFTPPPGSTKETSCLSVLHSKSHFTVAHRHNCHYMHYVRPSTVRNSIVDLESIYFTFNTFCCVVNIIVIVFLFSQWTPQEQVCAAIPENGVHQHILIIGIKAQRLLTFLEIHLRKLIPESERGAVRHGLMNYVTAWDSISFHHSDVIRQWIGAHPEMWVPAIILFILESS